LTVGDMVEVVDERDELYHCVGPIVDMTRSGQLVVQINRFVHSATWDGKPVVKVNTERREFDPHSVDIRRPLPRFLPTFPDAFE
jgi:hypothetical protein